MEQTIGGPRPLEEGRVDWPSWCGDEWDDDDLFTYIHILFRHLKKIDDGNEEIALRLRYTT